MTGAGFAQAVVFSFMGNPASTRAEVKQAAVSAGMGVSTPGLDKRFNAKGAYFLDSLLAEALNVVVRSVPVTPSILARFNGVYVGDSSVVELPEELATVFRGNNGATDAAAKVAVQWDMLSGGLGLWLSAGTVHDQRTGVVAHELPPGALRLQDLGFFNLATFAADSARGVYFLSRYKVGTLVYSSAGQRLDLLSVLPRQRQHALELTIHLGQTRLPCRLLALPVPPAQVAQRRHRLRERARRKQQPLSSRALALTGWTLYVTNIPPERLSLADAPRLACTRWQIECLFNLWKTQGHLDQSRSHDPCRVWCEFYAKLLALLIQHWVMVVGCWQHLNRSLYQATRLIRQRAFCLLDALPDLPTLIQCLTHTATALAQACQLSKRAAQPLTFQRWLEAVYV